MPIQALLCPRTIGLAAKQAGVDERTLRTWMTADVALWRYADTVGLRFLRAKSPIGLDVTC